MSSIAREHRPRQAVVSFLARGRGWVGSTQRDRLPLGQSLGQSQKRKDHRVLDLPQDDRGLLGGQFRTGQGLQGCCIEGLHTFVAMGTIQRHGRETSSSTEFG